MWRHIVTWVRGAYGEAMETTTNWIVATDSGRFWGRSWGADGMTFVRANAYRYPSPEKAAACIAELKAGGNEASLHVEELPSGRKRW